MLLGMHHLLRVLRVHVDEGCSALTTACHMFCGLAAARDSNRQFKVVQAAISTPPGTHNSWELAACKTSERFLHQQQQQQQQQLHTSHHHSSADLQQYGSLPAAGAGWYVRSNTAGGSTADLIAGTTGTGVDGKVTLGVLLGAGELRSGLLLSERFGRLCNKAY
jgi:hypothetical protein